MDTIRDIYYGQLPTCIGDFMYQACLLLVFSPLNVLARLVNYLNAFHLQLSLGPLAQLEL